MPLFKSKKKSISRGKLIVIAGDPKTVEVQQRLLVEALHFAGYQPTLINFPQTTSLGSTLLETYEKGTESTIQVKAIFRAIDRFEKREELEKELTDGKVIITTNFTVTNAGTGAGEITEKPDRVAFFKWVHNLEHDIFKIPKPDLNILLDSAPAGAGKADAPYVELARVYPNTKLLPTHFKAHPFTPQELHNSLWQLVRRITFRDFKPR